VPKVYAKQVGEKAEEDLAKELQKGKDIPPALAREVRAVIDSARKLQ
jgi:hypothetical protein